MKALSLLQPWASLVVLGHKRIETRSFSRHYHGPLLIHASLGKDYKKLATRDPLYSHYHALFARGRIRPIEQLQFGAIIGMVTMEAILPTEVIKAASPFVRPQLHSEQWVFDDKEEAFGDYSPGRYGWFLANAVAFPEPIPCKGMLGLWEPDAETMIKVNKAIEAIKQNI